jgi:hypothetical protein
VNPNDPNQPMLREAPKQKRRPSVDPQEPNPFAVHGDPSRRNAARIQENENGERPRRRLMWIRPSDLPTYLTGSNLMLRGIDLHAALVRRSWRIPAKAVEAVRRRNTPFAPEIPQAGRRTEAADSTDASESARRESRRRRGARRTQKKGVELS